MFNEDLLRQRLPISGLGEQLSFHKEVGSTNDVAHELANQGAPHGTLVVSESQTEGRGRNGSHWITESGSGLALSIILRPDPVITDLWTRLHALSALSVVQALEWFRLSPEIKWPNDILLGGKKVAGILVEISWVGDLADYIILGIGVNIAPNSVSPTPVFDIPAVFIEEVLGHFIDPYDLIEQLLQGISKHYSLINQGDLIENWGNRLAYLGKEVNLVTPQEEFSGTFLGLNHEGKIELQVRENETLAFGIGDYQMRLKV